MKGGDRATQREKDRERDFITMSITACTKGQERLGGGGGREGEERGREGGRGREREREREREKEFLRKTTSTSLKV